MPNVIEQTPITGDIAASADVRLDSKGGSISAILKKALRDRMGNLGDHLAGAALQFGSGRSIVLLSGAVAADDPQLRVRRTGRNRFEIEFEEDGEERIDEVTAAFLRLKRDQFERGLLRLSDPMDGEALRRRATADIEGAAQRLAKAGLRNPSDG